MCQRSFGITLTGALVAGVAGLTMGAGYGLLKDPSISTEMVQRRATGGALFVMGLYLWSPTFLHEFWLQSMRDD